MTSKELTELIHQNTRIILPEFGAFLVKDSGDKGFNPANVSFSPFLRYNDGMLEVYVAKKRGISKEEASKVVREFVETIKNELLEKGFYEVEGLGDLKRDQRGSLSFSLSRPDDPQRTIEKVIAKSDTVKVVSNIPTAIEITKDEKSDVWTAADKPIDESVEDKKPRKITGEKAKVEKLSSSKKVKNVPIQIEEPQPEPNIVKELESILEIEPENRIEVPQPIQPSKVEIPEEPKTVEKVNEIQIEDSGLPTLEPEHITNIIHEPKRKSRFTGLIYTAIAIVILVLLFILVRSYYFSPKIENIQDNSLVTSEPENIIHDKVDAKEKIDKPIDEIDKAFDDEPIDNKPSKEQLRKEKEQEDAIAKTLIKNSQAKNIENKTSSGIKFYIIAGSFKNPDFANKFVDELKNKGYDASIVIQSSGMNAVNIGSYSSREEANKALKEFKSKLPNIWILKK